jgi:hypothetical protein
VKPKDMDKLKVVTFLFFISALIEVVAEYFRWMPVIIVFKPLLSILLMIMYTLDSSEKNKLFYLVLITSMITNVLFISKEITFLFYGIFVFAFHRLFFLTYLITLIKIRDFIPVAIASIPFMFLFFYIFYDTDFTRNDIYILTIIHNVFISLMGGIALSQYIMNDSVKSTWLLISVILFVSLHFIIFIERFYMDLKLFRPIAMSLNVLGYYSFYRYVMLIENNKGWHEKKIEI